MVLMNRSCSSRPEGGSVTSEISLSEENGSESRIESEESGDDTAFSRVEESSGIPDDTAAEKPGASGAVMIPEKVILLFRPESYVLSETGRDKLESLATRIPDNSILEIGGHCADFGSERGRMALSLNRAETVAAYLSGRIPGSVQVNIRAYGSSVPVNTRPDHQDENRRVEIITEGGTE
jgi:OOP family OmpA-OmpF porin